MWRHGLFFCLLYFLQGATFSYVVNFQKPYLATHGISKEALGLFTSLLLLPFICKIFLGLISDRMPLGRWGSRKPYMIFGLGLFIIGYAPLAFLPPQDSFLMFASLSWIASLGLAWFDTCADGWAVDVAADSEQGQVQAFMVAGKALGFVLMSFIFGMVGYFKGAVFLILSGLALLILTLVIFVPYRPRTKAELEMPPWKSLAKTLGFTFAAFGILYSISSFGTDGLLSLYIQEAREGTPADLLRDYGVARGVGALLGGFLFAAVSLPHLGLRRSQGIALAFLGAGCLSPLLGLAPWLTGAVWGMAWGFQETAYTTLAMRSSKGALAATLFAVCMIFSNVGTALGEAFAAPMVPQIGYVGVFVTFAGLAWLSLILVPCLRTQ